MAEVPEAVWVILTVHGRAQIQMEKLRDKDTVLLSKVLKGFLRIFLGTNHLSLSIATHWTSCQG